MCPSDQFLRRLSQTKVRVALMVALHSHLREGGFQWPAFESRKVAVVKNVTLIANIYIENGEAGRYVRKKR